MRPLSVWSRQNLNFMETSASIILFYPCPVYLCKVTPLVDSQLVAATPQTMLPKQLDGAKEDVNKLWFFKERRSTLGAYGHVPYAKVGFVELD